MATFGATGTRTFGELFGPVGTHTFADYGATLVVTPLAVDPILTLIVPDQVATGIKVRLWAEYTDNVGATAVTVLPQFCIFRLDKSGVRQIEMALTTMIALGEGYYHDWVPSKDGTYTVTAATSHGGHHLFAVTNVTARARYDDTARALNDTLVSRF